MKKVLLASTALMGLAGAAAAEVSISGWAEMGIYGGGDDATNGSAGETQFFQDLDVTFTLSGESDSGLSFGAVVDLDESNCDTTAGGCTPGAFSPRDDGGTHIFISGAFGTLTMGDTDGALDWAVTENVGNPGSIADDETLHAGYNGNFADGAYDGQVLRYDYSFESFSVALSTEMDDSTGATRDDSWGLGVKYALDLGGTTLNLGLGYQTFDAGAAGYSPGNLGDYGVTLFAAASEVDAVGASVDAAFGGGFSAGIAYTQYSSNVAGEDTDHVGVSVGYESGPMAIGVNYGEFDQDGTGSASGWGVAAAYDLGGGLSVKAGYGDSDVDGVAGDFSNWSLGMAMSF